MKGRLRIAAVMMVCLVAVVALPMAAHAATFASQWPAPGSTLHSQPGYIMVDVFGTTSTVNAATINGSAAGIIQTPASAASWVYSEILVGSVYMPHWEYNGPPVAASTSLYAATVSVVGTNTVSVAGTTTGGVPFSTSWTYFYFTNGSPPPNPTPLPDPSANQTCRSANCHGTTFDADNAMGPDCSGCHVEGFAPHGFDMDASGHNTTLLGEVGALTKWDGSEGVLVRDSAAATITQEWPLPTASVFWSQSNLGSLSPTDAPLVAMDNRGFSSAAVGAAAIDTSVGWGSVVTCEDCHSGLAAAGPQGGNAVNFGLDPNFPDDWTKAEITSFDPTGMRKIDTTRDTPNPYYPKLGSNVYMPMEVENPSNPASPWAGMSIETTSMRAIGTSAIATSNPAFTPVPGFGNTSNITVRPGGFYGLTNVPSSGYSMGDSVGRFICQKCHKLTNSFQGLGIEGNGRGARDNNMNYMGMSNEAHMEHHNDLVTGQGNCVSCHIAIPHGWKRPRLLVYENDPAPYKVQYVWPDYQSTSTTVLRNMNPTNLLTGNWGFLSNPAATTTNRYKVLGDPNPSIATSWSADPSVITTYTSHLSKIDASAQALKELAVGPAEEFESYDALNSAAFSAITGIGVDWGGWEMDAEGVEWHGNPLGYFIPANAWDGATNSQVSISEYPIQNNCNACTSAGAGTHAEQSNVNTGGEGINPTLPYWK